MTRAQAKERNRRALLEAARRIVAIDGHRARLDDIAEQAGLTTGAVYSLFGSKNGLLAALVTDYLGPRQEGFEQAVPANLDLPAAVDAFARHYHRICADPDASRQLSFEFSLHDMALRDPDLRDKLAASTRAHEERLAALFTGRSHQGAAVTPRQARRLATALRALMVGLSQAVIIGGLPEQASDQYFADTARALATPEVLGPP